ncbi:hypothetical protein [Litchfieldella rifensis]|uniref:Uncharacterized protein n=1 Tax=Litchfieldella rifensis TaxID=762643 RepID=A0ABV7LK46_9GAMM
MCLKERLPRAKAGEHHQTTKRLLKGFAAFTSALLFGNGETKGLVRMLGAASLEAGKNVSQAILRAPTQTPSEKDNETPPIH